MRRPDRVEAIIARELADLEEYQGGAGADLRRLWREYVRPLRWQAVGALVMVIVNSVAAYGFPLTGRFLVDDVLKVAGQVDPAQLDEHYRLVAVVFGLNCLIWVALIVSQWLSHRLSVTVGQQLVFGLRRDLHARLQKLDIHYFERTPAGKVMSRLLDDVNVIQDWSTSQIVQLAHAIVLMVAGLGMMLWLNWRMALLVSVALPLYARIYQVLRPKIRRAHIAMRRLNSNMYGLAAERVRGIRVVKAFAAETRELHSLARMIFDHLRVGMRVIIYNQGLSLLAVVVSSLAMGVVMYLIFLEVRESVAGGGMSLGSAMAFLYVVRHVFSPAASLASMLTVIQALFVVIRRVLRVLDEQVAIVPGSIRLEGMKGKIAFDRVTFTYPDQTEPALQEVSFRIRSGEKVALMGPSGSGKSTIFHLLMRFYDPQEGEVRVGGVNLVDADPGSVRRHVRMVQQEPVIFSGTIADNVAYGQLDARPVEIMEAAKAAELHEFIMTQPVKYETTVGENGITLSGGQKQRLALATALLTDPEVLLLDDTTSALDSQTEARIRATLARVLQGRTSIIITQRVATARDCDRILVMTNGRVAQMGTHAELSQQDGFYQRICRQQEAV